jgi:hypothetical protein
MGACMQRVGNDTRYAIRDTPYAMRRCCDNLNMRALYLFSRRETGIREGRVPLTRTHCIRGTLMLALLSLLALPWNETE